jgi:hypothetical protein
MKTQIGLVVCCVIACVCSSCETLTSEQKHARRKPPVEIHEGRPAQLPVAIKNSKESHSSPEFAAQILLCAYVLNDGSGKHGYSYFDTQDSIGLDWSELFETLDEFKKAIWSFHSPPFVVSEPKLCVGVTGVRCLTQQELDFLSKWNFVHPSDIIAPDLQVVPGLSGR